MNFPSSPTAGSIYSIGDKSWRWNGYAWDSLIVDLEVMGNLIVDGNLTVSGGVTSSFSETVVVEDNIILLNSNVTGGSPSENAGIEVSRGASANVQLRWNESTDKWQFTNDGTQFYDLPTSVVNSWNGSTGNVTFSNYISSINGYTGAFTLTGTANEVEITGATSFVVGLPDTVTITNLTVTNSVTASTFDGALLGRVTTLIKNDDTITLTAGMPVYISGYQGSGNSGILLVKAADSSNSSTMPAVGLVETTLAVNGQGHVVELGLLGSLNTNGFSANQVVYIAPGGGLTATRPTAGTHLVQNIGRVVNASTTQGQIIVLGPGRSNDVPNRITVRDYLEMPNGQTATSLVTSWNGASGAVTYATPLATSSVTGVASFGNEFVVSAAGAVSLTGNYVKSWNGSTGAVTFSNYVTSVNGSTGAVTNIAKTDTAQTFTAIQSFALGFTANGATFTNNLYAGTIKGNQLNVQNTTSNIIGDYTNTLGGGYIQIDNSSGQAFNRIAGTLYTDAVRIGSAAVPALNVTGSIYTSGLINTTARVSCAGITSSGVSTFTGSLTSNNLYVSQGATFNSNAVFVSGLSADDIWITNGATFSSRSSFNAGITTNNLWVTNGATFSANTKFLSGIQTDSVLSTTGTFYINSDANGSGGNSITYIGDWSGANNGTSITVNDQTITISLDGEVVCNSAFSAGVVGAGSVQSTGSVQFGAASAFLSSQSTTLGTTAANQNIASVEIYDTGVDLNRSVEFFVQASHSSGYEALKIMVIHDGTNTYNTQYGLIRTGASLCSSYTTTITNGGAVLRLRATPTNTNTIFKVVQTVIPA